MQQYFEKLIQHLARSHGLKVSRVQRLLDNDPKWAERPEQMLVENQLVSKAELLKAKSELMGVAAMELDFKTLEPSVVSILPQAMALRYGAVCVANDGSHVKVAMVDPTDIFAVGYIQMRTGYDVELRTAYAGDVVQVIGKMYASGPPLGHAPVSIRERVGQEVVRARTLQPRGVSVGSHITETPIKPSGFAARRIALPEPSRGGVAAPSADRVALELARLSVNLINELDEDVLIDRILDTAMQLFRIEAASLLLIDWEKSQLFFREARGPGTSEILEMALPLDPNTSVAAWCVANRVAVNIPDVAKDPRHCPDVDRKVGYTTRTLLAAPILWRDEVLGVMEILNKMDGPFTDQDVEYAEILAAHAAQALHNTMAVRQLHNFYQQSLETLVDCYQAFDPVSRHHVLEVARLSTAIGRAIELTDAQLETLSYASLLHDIGKIKCTHGANGEAGVDASDTLHAEVGGEMLQQVTLFSRLVPAVRHHHERFDGSGKPDGLRGEQIPLLARILAVSESWCEECLPSIRGGGDRSGALERFLDRFGKDFDPALREPFLASTTL